MLFCALCDDFMECVLYLCLHEIISKHSALDTVSIVTGLYCKSEAVCSEHGQMDAAIDEAMMFFLKVIL
jgi:hypothetical protein